MKEIKYSIAEMTKFLENFGYTIEEGLEEYDTRGYRGEAETAYRDVIFAYMNDEKVGLLDVVFEKEFKQRVLHI